MAGFVTRQFGSWRGAVRLGLSYAEVAAHLASLNPPDPDEVRRFVFVCHGNICRSAYAEALAHKTGFRAASFGLSTSSGMPACADVVLMAQKRGVNLFAHQTTKVKDYAPLPGDYLLAMEVRQLRKLAADECLRHLPRGLVGSYAEFPLPHLHDPFQLDAAYMVTCIDRIGRAVIRLGRAFPNARIFPEKATS